MVFPKRPAPDGGPRNTSSPPIPNAQLPAQYMPCRQADSQGRGHGCWVLNADAEKVFLFDLPSPSRVREIGGPLTWPVGPIKGSGGTLVSAVQDPANWSRYSLTISRHDGREEIVIDRPSSADRVIELARRWGPLHFISVSTGLTRACTNLLRSAVYLDPLLPGGHRWALVDSNSSRLSGIPAAYNALRNSRLAGNASGYWEATTGPNDIVVFLHDDVHLLPNFELSIYEQVNRLSDSPEHAGSWCGMGLALASSEVGPGVAPYRGNWLDFGMLPYVLPVTTSARAARLVPDEAMIVTLRGSVGRFTEQLREFHCYGADFALSCLAAGKFVHATDTIIGSHKTWHDDGTLVVFGQSVEAWRHSIDQVALARAGKFVSDTWKHKVDLHPLRTTACPLNKTDLP